MEDAKYTLPTAQLIQHDLKLSTEDGLLEHTQDWDSLRNALAERIAYLLDHDAEFLMQAFYRIDLSEPKVKAALNGPTAEIAHELATLVLQRELQKAKTREAYRRR